MQLRPYQQDALHALSDFWHGGGGNPLLAMATGTGKSVVIAFLLKRLLSDYPKMRVLITVPNRELIDQDIKELRKVWPDATIGINCEGLGFRDTDTQILFVSINSIYRNPKAIGPRELIIIDEAHFIPHHDQGMYRITLEALRKLVPDLRVAGLTATPYRLDSGHLCEGEGHISIVWSTSTASAKAFATACWRHCHRRQPRRHRCIRGREAWRRVHCRSARSGGDPRRRGGSCLRRDRHLSRPSARLAGLLCRCYACRAGA